MSTSSKYRVTNWKDYNLSLKKRGSLTIWLNDDIDQHWYADLKVSRKQGRPLKYSQTCIECLLGLRQVFKLPLRQLTGFVESLFLSMSKNLTVPEFSRLSRRSSLLHLDLKTLSSNEETHIVIDSTGLKVFGEKEWLETKHVKQCQRKVWRKLHLSIDHQGYILSQELTDHKTDDRLCVSILIEQIPSPQMTQLLADSGYDSHKIYQVLEDKGVRVLIPPPAIAVVSSTTELTSRDRAVSYIKAKGYWAWFRRNNFGRRARVENTFYRIKAIFGRKLFSRLISNQKAEATMICSLLNKMTTLGMSKTIKVA